MAWENLEPLSTGNNYLWKKYPTSIFLIDNKWLCILFADEQFGLIVTTGEWLSFFSCFSKGPRILSIRKQSCFEDFSFSQWIYRLGKRSDILTQTLRNARTWVFHYLALVPHHLFGWLLVFLGWRFGPWLQAFSGHQNLGDQADFDTGCLWIIWNGDVLSRRPSF